MKINKIDIHGFGKLNDFSMELKNGINVVFGNNEAGKSTLQTFIKGMFFSLKGGRRTTKNGLAELKKFQPVENFPYRGTLSYTLDDSSNFLIERDFSQNTVKLYDNNLKDISNEFDQNRDEGVLFAQKQLGLSSSLFEQTCFVKQSNVCIEHKEGKNILEELSSQNGDSLEILSFRKAYDTLKDAIKTHVGTDRTTKAPLNIIENTLDKLYQDKRDLDAKREYFLKFSNIFQNPNFKKEDLENLIRTSSDNEKLSEELNGYLSSINEYERKISELTTVANGLEEQMATYKSMLDTYRENIREYKVFRIFPAGTTDELISNKKRISSLQDKIINLDKHLSEMKSVTPFNFTKYGAISSVSLLIILGLLYKGSLTNFLGILFGSIFLVSSFLTYNSYKNYKKDKAEFKSEKEFLESTLSGTKREIVDLESIIQSNLSKAGVSSLEEFVSSKSKYDYNYNLYNSSRQSITDSEKRMQSINESIEDYKKLITDIIKHLQDKFSVSSINKDLATIQQEISIKEDEKKSLQETRLALQIAMDTLDEVNEDLSNDFMPKLNSRLGEIICKITNNKYTNLSCDDSFNINTIAKNSSLVISEDYLSSGTTDQIYFALRIALLEIISSKTNESLPIILDEVFAAYDDIRTKETIEFLGELSNNYQIILFTCKNREVELIKDSLGENINLINIEN